MSCPIILENLIPGLNITIADLGELAIAIGATADVTSMFSLETIANSADLQTAINAGDIRLTYAGEIITDLSSLCITPTDLAGINFADWRWSAGRAGLVSASVDLLRFGGGSTNTLPFVAERKCEIRTFAAYSSDFPGQYNIRINKSVDGGTTWTIAKTELIDTRTKLIDYTSAPVALNPGDLIRTRFLRLAHGIRDPQVNLIVKQVA